MTPRPPLSGGEVPTLAEVNDGPTVDHAMSWCNELETRLARLTEAYVQLAVFVGIHEDNARSALEGKEASGGE